MSKLQLYLIILSIILFSAVEAKKTKKGSKAKGEKSIPLMESETKGEYYIGSWTGIDPLDGAQLQRSVVPAENGAILYTARNEASGACGSSPEKGQVIGLVNPIEGTVDEDGSVTFFVDFTCYGDSEPKFSGVPVSLSPLSKDIIIEQIAGYPLPIYLHRTSPPYMPL